MASARQALHSLIAKFKKRAERSERLMYEQSHRDYLRLVICIIVCSSWAVNHYRDNAITYKAQRDKNARELKLVYVRASESTCGCVSGVAAALNVLDEGVS